MCGISFVAGLFRFSLPPPSFPSLPATGDVVVIPRNDTPSSSHMCWVVCCKKKKRSNNWSPNEKRKEMYFRIFFPGETQVWASLSLPPFPLHISPKNRRITRRKETLKMGFKRSQTQSLFPPFRKRRSKKHFSFEFPIVGVAAFSSSFREKRILHFLLGNKKNMFFLLCIWEGKRKSTKYLRCFSSRKWAMGDGAKIRMG